MAPTSRLSQVGATLDRGIDPHRNPLIVSVTDCSALAAAPQVFVHVRNIRGDIIRTIASRPTETITVPSLGFFADQLADSIGHLPSTILRIHCTHLEADRRDFSARYFVEEMTSHGMAEAEAWGFWNTTDIPYNEDGTAMYRDRLSFELE